MALKEVAKYLRLDFAREPSVKVVFIKVHKWRFDSFMIAMCAFGVYGVGILNRARIFSGNSGVPGIARAGATAMNIGASFFGKKQWKGARCHALPSNFSKLAAAVFSAFTSFCPLSSMANPPEANLPTELDPKLPDMVQSQKGGTVNIVPGPGSVSAQAEENGVRLILTPEYSTQTGGSLGLGLASLLGERAAVGLLFNIGPDKQEVLLNGGVKLGNSQRIFVSAGQLKQSLDFSFPSGQEKSTLTQGSLGLGYQFFLGQGFLRYLEANAYVSRTKSRDLADKTFGIDSPALYELWNDPRRIAGGKVSGSQGRLGFSPIRGSMVKVSLGYEHLSYDLLSGSEVKQRPTAGLEWQQHLNAGFLFNLSADSFAAQNRYSFGVARNFGDASGNHRVGLNLIDVHGRDGLGNDRQVQLAYSFTFGAANRKGEASEMSVRNPDATSDFSPVAAASLLDQVSLRPNYLPARVIAKVDNSARPSRLVAISKNGLPSDSTIDAASGDITVALGTTVTGFAAITRNLAAFANSGQFVLGSTNLTIRPRLMQQPATGATDTYVVTLDNIDGSTTTVTIVAAKGSVQIVSIVVTHSNQDAAPVALAPTVAKTDTTASLTNGIADSDGLRNVTYYIYADAGATTLVAQNTTGSFSGLAGSTNYYARTSAETRNGLTNVWTSYTSGLRAFTTDAPLESPPSVLAPTIVKTDTTAALTNGISDPDGVRNITYYIYADAGATSLVAQNSTGSFSGLAASTAYFARTSAETRNGATSTWTSYTSGLRAFTTDAPAVTPFTWGIGVTSSYPGSRGTNLPYTNPGLSCTAEESNLSSCGITVNSMSGTYSTADIQSVSITGIGPMTWNQFGPGYYNLYVTGPTTEQSGTGTVTITLTNGLSYANTFAWFVDQLGVGIGN